MSVNSLKKKCRHLENSDLEDKCRWKELSQTYDKLGQELRRTRSLDEALYYHDLDRELCNKHQDVLGEALATRMIGEVYIEQGKFPNGLQHLKQYLSISEGLQDPVNEQRALATLCWAYLTKSQNDNSENSLSKSLYYCKKCLAAVSKIPSKLIDTKERVQMTGRALENLGKVHWRSGKRKEAANSFDDAERNFRNYKQWADLHRLSDTRAAMILEAGDGDLNKALDQCQISLEAATKVGDEATADSLFTMFKVKLANKQLEEAKECLRKARACKVDKSFSKTIENNLKMMIIICKNTDLIMKSNSGSLMSHEPYEAIADALCKFDGNKIEKQIVLKLALEYYNKAFIRAENEGSTEYLADLNNSIAKTYEDLGDYDNSLAYYEKQLEFEKGKIEEQCATYSHIAMVREYMKSGYELVMKAREEWLRLAETSRNKGKQIEALMEIFRFQTDSGHLEEADKTRIKIESLGGSVDENERSCSQGSYSSGVSDNFPEINLDEDLAPPSVQQSKIARRTPAEYMKRNAKGEYPLHKELQRRGQDNKIISMIERGHPLEVEDNAGWTPLGEAVGNANIGYVKILVDAGANLNHRNDKGETPLIAASCHGFLDIIEFLLDKGAKVDIRSKEGDTALGFLKFHLVEAGKRDCDPTYKAQGVVSRLEAAVHRVEKMFSNLGLSRDVHIPQIQDSPSFDDDWHDNDNTLTEEINHAPLHSSTQRPPRSPSPESRSSANSSSPLSRSPVKATQIYKEAMDCLRGTSSRNILQPVSSKPTSTNRGGAEEFLDDWLVDDMKQSEVKKKRKRTTIEESTDDSVKRNKNSENHDPIDLTLSPLLKPVRNKLSLKKKKDSKQPLISSLMSRSRTPSPLPDISPTTPEPPEIAPTSTHPAPGSTQSLSMTRVKISIAGEIFLVPVPDPSQTVSWLAKEAALRYYRQLGSEPVLKLRTGDGAVLDPGDQLNHVLSPGDQISAEVVHWNNKPAAEKYRDSCRDLAVPSFKNISDRLMTMTSTNVLKLQLRLKKQHAEPLWASLRGNQALRHLELSYCKLDDTIVSMLCQVLPSIPNLSSLDLSYNSLTSTSLTSISTLTLSSLTKFSVSGNLLDDYCLPTLCSLLKSAPNLTKLQMSRCNLTKTLFQSDRFEFSNMMKKSKLKHLNLSHNNFSNTGLEILLTCLPSGLNNLDITGCNLAPSSSLDQLASSFVNHCQQGSPNCDLISLSISSLTLSDSGLIQLSSSLQYCGRLLHLYMDHNLVSAKGLLSVLKTILDQSVPVTRLSCAMEEQTSKQFWSDKTTTEEVIEVTEQLLSSNCSRLELMVLPYSQDSAACLSKLWNSYYKSRSKHSRDGLGNIVFSVQ